MEKITQSELIKKLRDPNTSLSDASQYFIEDPEPARPYSPRFKIDPSKVELVPATDAELQHESIRGGATNILNWFHAMRRQNAFALRIHQGWDGLRFVAEGDSWFQYPVSKKDDLIDFLDEKHAIYCISAAGDEFEYMLGGMRNISTQIKTSEAHGLLFSGGGNDIVGKQFPGYLVAHQPHFQPENYIDQKFGNFIESARQKYIKFFNFLFSDHPDLKIFYHGYDHAIPSNGGTYLEPHLVKKKVPAKHWNKIVEIMIDRYNDLLKEVALQFPDRVFHVDCRGEVRSDWRDELHAAEDGCRRAAKKFDDAIERVLGDIAVATASNGQFEAMDDGIAFESADGGGGEAPAPNFVNASEEQLQEEEILPEGEIGVAEASGRAPKWPDPQAAPGQKYESVQYESRAARWPSNDKNSTEYAHLDTQPQGDNFQFTPADLERLIDLNHFELATDQGKIVFALRGAALKRGNEAENKSILELKDVRPDHVNLRCVMGFYDMNKKKFWAYTASTVPNARNMEAYYRKHHGLRGRKLMANMLPSGAYVFRRGGHGYDRASGRWRVPRALRLTNPETGADGTTIVLRTRNDLIYGTADYWHKTTPTDNIHPAFSMTASSSAGCLTIRGSNRKFSTHASGQWKKFLAHISNMQNGAQIGLVLLTGADAAIASKMRHETATDNAELLTNNLERLRIGSSGDQVKELQEFLDREPTGIFDADTKLALIEMQKTVLPIGKADGIYSPEMDELFGLSVLTEPKAETLASTSDMPDNGSGNSAMAVAASVATVAISQTVPLGDATPIPDEVATSIPVDTTPHETLESHIEQHGHDDEEDLFPDIAFEDQQDADWSDSPNFENAGPELWYPSARRTIAMRVKGNYKNNYPLGAVIHSTEGRSKNAQTDAENTIRFGIKHGHCYFCIAGDGTVYQPAPLSKWGIHAGRCDSPTLGRRLDNKLVGIEVCCAGILKKTDDGYKTWWGDVYPETEARYSDKVDNVTEAGFYHKFSDAQEQALRELLLWLHQNNPDVFKLENVVGHDEVAVHRNGNLGRKQDPGASLSMPVSAYRKMLIEGLSVV